MLYGRREVWLVTERRGGQVFKTKDTGKSIWICVGSSSDQEARVARAVGGKDAMLVTPREYDPMRNCKQFNKTELWFSEE